LARSLAKNQKKLPHPGTIIASSFTSPMDCLYLAAIFDPVFTASYPGTRLVEQISLFQAMIRALYPPQLFPSPNARLVPVEKVVQQNPDSAIVVLPEVTTSNGRGILAFSPSLLSAPANAKIFPVNLRYTPADITTPIPGAYITFLWDLCSKPTHCIRVRIAEAIYNTSQSDQNGSPLKAQSNSIKGSQYVDSGKILTAEESKLLDRVAEDLARLGRVKRVGLGVKEKIEFIKAWTKTRSIW
jgi:hypothetical protein